MNNLYRNYISGPISQVSGCLEIVLYNKSSFPERISVYNLKNFYLKYLIGSSSDKHVRLVRGSASTEFKYNRQLEKGFNIIVYLNPDSSLPVGYTEFINTLGDGVALSIGVNIRRTLKGMLDLEISNKLVGKDLSKKFLGKDISEYSSLSNITERNYRNLFTTNIGRLTTDSFSFIVGSSGFLTKDESWKLGVNRDVTISNLGNNTRYNVCFYNGDLVLACWNGKNYALYSLIGTNSSRTGTTKEVIQRIEGRYFLNEEGILKYLDVIDGNVNKSVFSENHGIQFVDFQSKECTAYNLPILYTKSDILKYIPEINNIYLDLDNYLRSNQLIIHSKIGSWFILKTHNYNEESVIYIAVSPTSVIYMTGEDLETAFFVGDQTMILRDDDHYFHYYYIYNTSGIELYTEKARAVLFNGRLDWWGTDYVDESYTFKFCFSDNTEEDDKHFEEYFGENGLVHVVYGYEELSGTVLMKYRRNIYPDYPNYWYEYRIPMLVGSYGGLIFYNNNNKISFL